MNVHTCHWHVSYGSSIDFLFVLRNNYYTYKSNFNHTDRTLSKQIRINIHFRKGLQNTIASTGFMQKW